MIVCARCEDILPGMKDDSVDLIVTDPPYGISFMGKDWDRAVPSVAIWRECLRVLKPGCFAFVMCIPRQDCQAKMVLNLLEAGFDVSYSPLYHVFASGFNKSMNMSKAVDKRLGAEREVIAHRDAGRGLTRADKRNANEGFEAGHMVYAETLPATPEALVLDGSYSGLQLKPALEIIIVAQKPDTRKYRRSDVYAMLGGKYAYWYTSEVEVKDETESDRKKKAKLEEKWGREFEAGDIIERRLALDPTLNDEMILNRAEVLWSRAYKDSDITSTITAALDDGHGITWLDDGRIPCDWHTDPTRRGWQGKEGSPGGILPFERRPKNPNSHGRFPANLLVSDDVLNDGREYETHYGNTEASGYANGSMFGLGAKGVSMASKGSFSRYFSLDQWAIANLPESVQRTFPFLIVPKAAKKEKNLGCEGLPEQGGTAGEITVRGNTNPVCQTCGGSMIDRGAGACQCKEPNWKARNKPHRNAHPTVKPLKLMSYLITLGSRPGDLVLDLFAGTCTTGMAAKTLGRDYLMVEQEEEWCQIGKRRIDAVEAKLC